MANSATTPRDNFLHGLRSQQNRINYQLGGSSVSFDFFMGDLLWYDTSVDYVKPLDSDAHAAYLVGVALRNAYIAPYASMQQNGGPAMVKNYFSNALVGFGDVYTYFTTAGDTYSPGDAVYLGADCQTITNTAGGSTHSLGTVYLPQGGTVSGASTTLVPILIVPQIPVQSL